MSRPSSRWRPADAVTLLRSPTRIGFACDPARNPRFSRADARSAGADGRLVADELSNRAAVDAYAGELERLVQLPIGELDLFVQNDRRMALLVRQLRKQPWDDPARSAKRRAIVVPTVLRRCLSNLVADVLAATVEDLLPSTALAYRPGRRDAVTDAILDTASDIHFGGKFFVARYDVKNAFPSLPWEGIADALSAVGYPPEFILFAMALVRAPRVVLQRGRAVPVLTDRGCAAGLPESATLLNVFFRPLDLAIAARFPSLSHPRYSDDGLIAGSRHHLVVGAFRAVQRFAESHGLSLKRVDASMSAGKAVHDLRREPVEFLGATLYADGDVEVSSAKVERQLRKLRYLRTRLPAADGAPEVSVAIVAARSVYGGGRPQRTYDVEDIQRSVLQFFLYCRALNEGQAVFFLRRAERELRMQLQRPPRHLSSLVWVAALRVPDAARAGDPDAPRSISSRIEHWFRAVMTERTEGHLEECQDVPAEPMTVEPCTSDEASALSSEDRRAARGGSPREGEESDSKGEGGVRVDSPSSDREGECSPAPSASASHSTRDESDNLLFSRLGPSSDSLRIGADKVNEMIVNRWARRASPAPGPHGNVHVVHLVARRFARRDAEAGGAIVGIQPFGATIAVPPTLRVYRRAHEAAAIVAALHDLSRELSGARSHAPGATLLVLLETSELPKQLLQTGRALRTPRFYTRVRDLHRASCAVVLAGPWSAPIALVRAVRDASERRARAVGARRSGAAHPPEETR